MENQELLKIRTLAIIALFVDDDLMERFVLKGGNALNIAYGFKDRASTDIDVSMNDDFEIEEFEEVKLKLKQSFESTFAEEGYHVFDIKFTHQPLRRYPETEKFWGGYRLEFKVIRREKLNQFKGDIDALRRNSIVVGNNQERVFTIDISKYEYCKSKMEKELDGYTIYVYSPVAVVYEKLRAICQQMEEYQSIVMTHRRVRARDFFDIYTILEGWEPPINICDADNLNILEEIFKVKKVPLSFLGLLETQREFHRDGYSSLKDVTDPQIELNDYDYYFDYVLEKVESLKPFWEV